MIYVANDRGSFAPIFHLHSFVAAAGKIKRRRDHALEIKVFDPCCQSVLLFGIFFQMKGPSKSVVRQAAIHCIDVIGKFVSVVKFPTVVSLSLSIPLSSVPYVLEA